MDLQRHALSALFMDISSDEFDALKSDVSQNGFTDPTIIVCDGQVLDGWHRYRVATELALLDRLDFVDIEGDPVAFVISKNLHRRHLTASQRAQIVVEANEWNSHGGDRKTDNFKSPNGDLKTEVDLFGESYQPPTETKTRDEMAQVANVGTRTIDRAKSVSLAGRSDEVLNGQKSATAVIKEEKEKASGYHNKGEVEWYTPLVITDRVRQALGGQIDLDPASCAAANEGVQAAKFFDKGDDGLNQKWEGTVFVNPPFSELQAFTDKFIAEAQCGNMTAGCFLADSHTQPNWFMDLAAYCTAFFMYTERAGRFEYWNEDRKQGGKARGYIFYEGADIDGFVSAFKDIGRIYSEVIT